MNPIEQYAVIQDLVRKDAEAIANEVYDEKGTQFGVADVPVHTHNGVDALPISFNNVVGNIVGRRITRRVVTVTQSATPSINTDLTDVAAITGLAQAVTSFTTNLSGTPVAGDSLIIEITDDGTARNLSWGTSFESSGNVTLPATTVVSTKLTVGFFWNATTTKWRCSATA